MHLRSAQTWVARGFSPRPAAFRHARRAARKLTHSLVSKTAHAAYLMPGRLAARAFHGRERPQPETPSNEPPRFDRHRSEWLETIEKVLAEAGVPVGSTDRPWAERPILHLESREEAWNILSSLAIGTPGTTIQTLKAARPLTAFLTRLWSHAVGRDFAAARLPAPDLSRPVDLLGSPPSRSRWLITRHVVDPKTRRHIGTEAGVEVSFAEPGPSRALVDFPVDAVYTWVDGDDPEWLRRYVRTPAERPLVHAATESARFHQADELRYSLRSVAEFAPWIRHIWVVTAGQRPSWLMDHPKVTVVDHADIWPDLDQLPTFNSQAIEANLHRIKGLAEHYLYFNDDFFLGRPVSPERFFTAKGRPKVFRSPTNIPPGDPLPTDLAPVASGKNNRRLVAQATGHGLSHKYLHTPQALRRSMVRDLESLFPDEFYTTSGSRFRSTVDITVSGGLHHSYGLATGQAVAGYVRYRYVDLENPDFGRRLHSLLSYRFAEVFCLNAVLEPLDMGAVVDFLDSYYPAPAEWEGMPSGTATSDARHTT